MISISLALLVTLAVCPYNDGKLDLSAGSVVFTLFFFLVFLSFFNDILDDGLEGRWFPCFEREVYSFEKNANGYKLTFQEEGKCHHQNFNIPIIKEDISSPKLVTKRKAHKYWWQFLLSLPSGEREYLSVPENTVI